MAKKDAEKLANLFRPEARGKLKQDSKGAAKDAGGSDELADFFDSLSDQEIDTLTKTWDAMQRLDITGKADGATVSFL